MTPEQVERATFLLKRLSLVRTEVRHWAMVKEVAISVAPDDFSMNQARPVVVTGDSAKWVLSYAFEALKTQLDAVEAELISLGVEFEPQQLVVGAVVFGAPARTN